MIEAICSNCSLTDQSPIITGVENIIDAFKMSSNCWIE